MNLESVSKLDGDSLTVVIQETLFILKKSSFKDFKDGSKFALQRQADVADWAPSRAYNSHWKTVLPVYFWETYQSSEAVIELKQRAHLKKGKNWL